MPDLPEAITIRPGYLVAVSTSIKGGVLYEVEELSHREDGVLDESSWNTTRTILNKPEYTEAKRVRQDARNRISSACVTTPFGLVCPAKDHAQLVEAITEARAMVNDFNEGATVCRVRLHTVRGKIARNDLEAVRAIKDSITDLLIELEQATKSGKVTDIRGVAKRAVSMGKMLKPGQAANDALQHAVDAARSVASDLAKRVEDEAAEIEAVLAEADLSPISQARFAFMGKNSSTEEK